MQLRIAMLMLLLVLLAACKREAESTATPAPATKPDVAQPVRPARIPAVVEQPTLRIATLDGKTFDLAEQRGKWVIVNFWATWCGPCLKEMPELSALDAMREHIVVIGLAYEDNTPEAMQAFMKTHPVVYPIALVDVYDPPKDFETPRGLPMTYIITPDGKVAKQYTGPVTARMIEDDIAKAGGPKAG
ncbi:TlpA disulfide reductase family protein [Thermomonas sp. HDW16]|uniref:TlpA family protein disulfide reductase n=1 Tax=Thermomonas sp. HDW16 TaxID=2714945 RepID=UPI001409F2DA|nr:TlpA disulfide reductase family protein [Thermomonas sp. HDW16]QIL21300.1 TlpA family protein disulfide reductase [Thermomonas sp. HDW16]